MDAATRSILLTQTLSPTTGNGCWETAPAVWRKIQHDFGPFAVDLCADPQRHLCPLWMGPGAGEGLEDCRTADWGQFDGPGFANPPYGAFLKTVLPKAVQEAVQGVGSLWLLPCRFAGPTQDLLKSGWVNSVYLCTRRLVFWAHGAPRINPKTGKPDVAPFDSMLVVVGLPPPMKLMAEAFGVHQDPLIRFWDPPSVGEMGAP